MEGDLPKRCYNSDEIRISIHSLRMEGDAFCVTIGVRTVISIHSLRMEGDQA